MSHRSNIFDFLSIRIERIEMFWMICSWWCHVVTCLTWPFWSLWLVLSWDNFWFLFYNQWVLWFTLEYFLLARWELMDIVIYHLMLFSYSWRNDVILWLSLWCFLVTCIGLRWSCDFWFHGLRVGYLYVVSRSGLQWGLGP